MPTHGVVSRYSIASCHAIAWPDCCAPVARAGHTSAWYVSEWLRVGGADLSPAAVALGTAYVKYAGGVMRAVYPSGMPAGALAPWAYQTGAAVRFRYRSLLAPSLRRPFFGVWDSDDIP